MKAAFLDAKDNLSLRSVPRPELHPGTVMIKLAACGICGSDVHLYHEGCAGKFQVEFPFILGHECAGIIVEAAPDVTTLSVGMRVAVEPAVPCGNCEYCLSGSYNLCPQVQCLAAPPTHGCLQEYLVHSALFVHPIPDSLSMIEGALLEPLAVGFHACLTANIRPGDRVMITGAGCIGLVCLLVARSMGAAKIMVCDPIAARMSLAKKLGADVLPFDQADAQADITAICAGKGPDVVIDAAGFPETVRQAIAAVRPGGTIVYVGLGADLVDRISLASILQKELRLNGVFRYRNNYPMAIRALENRLIDVMPLISHTYPFEETPRAFQEAINRRNEITKGVILFEN